MRSVFLVALLVVPSVVRGQETASDTLLTVNHYLDWEQVADPQVSPDGSQIVYTRRWVNKIEDRWDSGLWIMSADGTRNRFLLKGSNARWSPDGTRIAYFADGEPKGTQVFVRWMDAEGATSQVTRVSENPTNLSWAPDGRSLAFTMLVKSETPWKISMPAAPEGAKWTPAPRIVDRLHYRRDRTGYIEQGTTQIFLVSAEGGTQRQLTSGDFATSELGGSGPSYDWTPDGRTIVFDGLREADADYRFRESYLYAVDVKSGAVRPLVSKKGGWSGPVVSPDGRTVAFTGHEQGRQSYRADEVWVVGIDGTGMRALTTYDRDPGALRWSPDGSGVFFALGEQGTSTCTSLGCAAATAG
jgi:Tol biopolymer transport system component